MSGLLALAANVDAKREGQLDWPAFLRVLADEYHGRSALVAHDFGQKQAGANLMISRITASTMAAMAR